MYHSSAAPSGVASACTGSACTGSACTGSAFTGDICTGNACAGYVWTGNAWPDSACTAIACDGSACPGSACPSSACHGSACAGTRCVVSHVLGACVAMCCLKRPLQRCLPLWVGLLLLVFLLVLLVLVLLLVLLLLVFLLLMSWQQRCGGRACVVAAASTQLASIPRIAARAAVKGRAGRGGQLCRCQGSRPRGRNPRLNLELQKWPAGRRSWLGGGQVVDWVGSERTGRGARGHGPVSGKPESAETRKVLPQVQRPMLQPSDIYGRWSIYGMETGGKTDGPTRHIPTESLQHASAVSRSPACGCTVDMATPTPPLHRRAQPTFDVAMPRPRSSSGGMPSPASSSRAAASTAAASSVKLDSVSVRLRLSHGPWPRCFHAGGALACGATARDN
eukprot:361040-Chlamydomonas_euryale.AAC.4